MWSLSVKVKVLVTQSCNPMDCSLPGSSIHGILQAKIQEWIAIPFSRGSSRPLNFAQTLLVIESFLSSFMISLTPDSFVMSMYFKNGIRMFSKILFSFCGKKFKKPVPCLSYRISVLILIRKISIGNFFYCSMSLNYEDPVCRPRVW